MSTQNPAQSTACDELRDLLPAYAVGALDPNEVAHVQALLRECPQMQAELEEYTALTTAFYERVEPVTPPADLHDRLMAQVRQQGASELVKPDSSPTSTSQQPQRLRWLGWGLAAAAALLLIVSNVFWANQMNAAQRTITGLRVEHEQLVAAAQSQIASLHDERQQIVRLASASDLQRVQLLSTADESGTVLAALLWQQGADSALLTSASLPGLAANQTYQLWLIEGEQPVSAGIFNLDENGIVTVDVPLTGTVEQYQAVAISVEPEGGSDAPSSTPIAVGTI